MTIAWARRALLALLTFATTGWAVAQMAAVLAGNHGLGPLDLLLIILFAACFVWIAFSFWAAIAGFCVLVGGLRQPGLILPDDTAPLRSRTAIVMAVHNEQPARVFANIEAMHETLLSTGELAAFDFYVLSDSTDPDIWIEEERAWYGLTCRLGSNARVFYRRRRDNTGKKAGNIADFCRRWGRHYAYMVVLDADSLMDGPVLVAMARIMDANPRAGLVQAPPQLINRSTIFARMMQFAGRVYGPVFAAGQAYWQLGDGNYWGHNAIIRVAAFTAACGLPLLPGRPPFGGHILSHDFVEAALLRRAGWSLWLVRELEGSYEEPPPTLVDYARRDHRWCQGNLQHARVVGAPGLHPVSRFHLVSGIMSYVSAPLWLAFLVIGLAVAAVNTVFPRAYFGAEKQLFPNWPIFDAALAQNLFLLALGYLLVPRLLGVVAAIVAQQQRRAQGGAGRIALSAALELICSTLLAPTLMLFQSRFVLATVAGRSIGWSTQNRDDRGIGWRSAARAHLGHMLVGAAAAVLADAIDQALFWWLSPVIVGLVLAIPIAQLTSRRDLGAWLRRRGLFAIPEETSPPRVLARAEQLARGIAAELGSAKDGLAEVLSNPRANAVHRLLFAAAEDPPAENDHALEVARRKLAAGSALTPAEKRLLLYDPHSLARSPGVTGRDSRVAMPKRRSAPLAA